MHEGQSDFDVGRRSELTEFGVSAATGQCYCNGRRELGTVELQCGNCMKWFHGSCLQDFRATKCVPFMVNYCFLCRLCNPHGTESFTQRQANFAQMCITALANLTYAHMKGPTPKTMFSRDGDIIPYIDAQWESLTSMPRRVKQTWHQTIHKAMTKETEMFSHTALQTQRGGSDDMFSLVVQDLFKIAPNYESLVNPKSLKAIENSSSTSIKAQLGSSEQQAFARSNSNASIGSGGSGSGQPGRPRGNKRKAADSSMAVTKRSKNEGSSKAPLGIPVEYPFNRDGYRYFLAEDDKFAPNRQRFDDSNDYAGKPIPGYFYRIVRPSCVQLSSHDRAPQLKLSDDRYSVTGEKGYSVVRCSHGVARGRYYFEAGIAEQPEGSHARIGWSQPLGCLQAPVGYDKFSYSWRSRKGTIFHDSVGKHYCDTGYTKGDVLGFYIELPERKSVGAYLPITGKDLPLVKFKNFYYYEEKDEPQKALKSLKRLPGSKIVFYKNGQCMGVAWGDIYEGTYYPAISLYKNATVWTNFGPNFKFPPANMTYKPLVERNTELMAEQCLADVLFFVENEGKLTLD